MITRRYLLKLCAGAGATLLFKKLPAFAQSSSMLLREIPSSGAMLPAVGLGTARTFNVGTDEDVLSPLREVMRLFIEMGGTLIDTAPAYGSSEEVTGGLIRDLDVLDDLFLATKVSTRGRDQAIEQMRNSMRLLGSESLELMQIHNVQRYDSDDVATLLAILREWKAAGRLRYIGITTSSLRAHERVSQLLQAETLDFVQVNYSIGTRQAEERLLPLAADRGVAVIVNRPYERARLFRAVGERAVPDWAADFDCDSWGQFFLKYILSNPAVTCVIPATTKPHHLQDNMGAGYGRLPDGAARDRMVEFFDAIPGT
ncbi:MAG: aldo/keto reductase [Candidatus Palauibacterales bacterium]|nr:aldo/keto reductase [Candidatus Palauibacterales bacterium]